MNDITEITQLVLHERQARDRGWWESMDDCFAPDSTVRLSWFTGSGAQFTARSREMTGRGDATVHRLCPPVVDVQGERAMVELLAAIEMRTLLTGPAASACAVGHYQWAAACQPDTAPTGTRPGTRTPPPRSASASSRRPGPPRSGSAATSSTSRDSAAPAPSNSSTAASSPTSRTSSPSARPGS